eukprot:g6460.t1
MDPTSWHGFSAAAKVARSVPFRCVSFHSCRGADSCWLMPEESEEPKRSITEVIESLGYGPSQILTCLLVNGSWLADGCELLVLSSISTILATDWDLSPLQQGVLLSSVYVGVLMGNLMSGWVGDRLGRRSAVLLSFPIIALLSVASSLANGFWVLLPLRYFVGFGFGLGQPSAIAILMEVSPGRYRPLNQALAQIAFALGELYCCLVMWFDDPRMIHLHWRTLLDARAKGWSNDSLPPFPAGVGSTSGLETPVATSESTKQAD